MAELKRKYYNRSTINLHHSSETQKNTHFHSFYANSNQISSAMDDFSATVMKTEPKQSANIINHQNNHYEVPIREQNSNNKQNKGYLQYFQKYKVFNKPNGISTKYNEIIIKNKLLIRKPYASSPNKQKKVHLQKKTITNNVKFRPFRYSAKQSQASNQHQSCSAQRPDSFNKTISTYQTVFHMLLNKDRCKKSQSIALNNSMSRLIAAESVYQHLYPKNNNYTATKKQ